VKWAYYNDNDAFCCDWLRNLMVAGHIPEGEVDQRPIQEVAPSDVEGFRQVHFFAGIGGWAYALRLAGWPEERPVWTGSCPCQPYSQATQGQGAKDPRNLWPEFRRLIRDDRPPVIFGEQVASKAGRGWLAGVRADLEALGYALGAADLCAAGLAAPHIRQRLWWVANAISERRRGRCDGHSPREARRLQPKGEATGPSHADRLADAQRDTEKQGRTTAESQQSSPAEAPGPHAESGRCRNLGGMGNAGKAGLRRDSRAIPGAEAPSSRQGRANGRCSDEPLTSGPWGRFDLVPCADGKARRVEPSTFPLAHGVPARVGRLRAYGNAIVPQVAAAFIQAYREAVE
jgi:DNA (cytosine-5)-methyltransferase 1